MDRERFDNLTRFLSATSARRGALAGLAGGIVASLAALGDHAAVAKKMGNGKRKRKPCRCGFCRTCKRGRCVLAGDGTDCGECGTCAAGSCVPKVNQTLCDLCTTCQAGRCVNKPVGTPCSTSGQCDGGECFFPPGCDAFPTACTSGASCCSGGCCEVLGAQYCCRSEPGDPCYVHADCVEGASCVAYRCRSLG
jgi:hypothetical protein